MRSHLSFPLLLRGFYTWVTFNVVAQLLRGPLLLRRAMRPIPNPAWPYKMTLKPRLLSLWWKSNLLPLPVTRRQVLGQRCLLFSLDYADLLTPLIGYAWTCPGLLLVYCLSPSIQQHQYLVYIRFRNSHAWSVKLIRYSSCLIECHKFFRKSRLQQMQDFH